MQQKVEELFYYFVQPRLELCKKYLHTTSIITKIYLYDLQNNHYTFINLHLPNA